MYGFNNKLMWCECGCESWMVKKSECQRIDAFELWCWRRCLRVPWTARRSNQSILKEISPGCSLEGWMLKLKLQYFGHLMWRVDSMEKIPMLGRIGGKREGDDRGWDGWMSSPTRWTWVWVDSGSWWWTEAWCAVIHGVAKSRTRLRGWTELKGNQFWTFIGSTDAEAETPILWPPDAKNGLIGKDPDARKDWRREEKGTTEDEMVGWHPRLYRWLWVNSENWWWIGKPGMLQSMGS